MRFLANENFPHESIRLLRDAGHDVEAVGEDESGAGDPHVMARARRDQRVLLTFDRDYGELIFHRGRPAPPGVIYFRTDPALTELPAFRTIALLADPDLSIEGMFTVIEPERTRQRPLP